MGCTHNGKRVTRGFPWEAACRGAMNAVVVIPPRSCRKTPIEYDSHLHKARHAVENLFARLKPFRSLATRYDKTVRNDSAMVAIACIVLWLRL